MVTLLIAYAGVECYGSVTMNKGFLLNGHTHHVYSHGTNVGGKIQLTSTSSTNYTFTVSVTDGNWGIALLVV